MSNYKSATKTKIDGVIIGLVTAVDASGAPLVAYAGNESELPIVAKSTVAIDSDAVGREVALLFENCDVARPIIMGLIHNASQSRKMIPQETESNGAEITVGNWLSSEEKSDLKVDGKRIQFDAKDQIVLKCGKSSITMTRAGKVIIRGAYISTRSSGANRIKGGSVQIN